MNEPWFSIACITAGAIFAGLCVLLSSLLCNAHMGRPPRKYKPIRYDHTDETWVADLPNGGTFRSPDLWAVEDFLDRQEQWRP